MSSFKETFTKNEKQDSNLEYDDTAFYYFFICILGMILIPLVYKIIKPLLFNQLFKDKSICKCKICKQKVAKLQRQKRFNWVTKGYIFTVIVTVLLALLLKDCYIRVTTSVQLKSFDPYEILGINPSANEAEIKKAYRQMTIKFHPDKNKDDPQATAKFIKITKAYECLTDPKTRAIFEKYGSPDGPGLFNVAIALPSFLLKKQNHVAVLCIFFLVLLVLIPGVILWWYSESAKYDTDGLLIESKKIYYQILNENLIAKSCPILVSYSKEFSDEILVQRGESEKQDLTKLWSEVKTQISKLPALPTQLSDRYMKCLILVSSYLLQLEIPSYLDKDLLYILERVPSLLEVLTLIYFIIIAIKKIVSFASSLPRGHKQIKYMGLRCVLVLIEFEQMIVQGLWISDHYLNQISYFIENDVTRFVKKAKKLTNLSDLLKQEQDERKVFNYLDQTDQQQINQELSYFPELKVDYKIEVDGEEGIQVNDIITVTVNLERMNLNDGEEAGFVHSLRYPFVKEEYWYVIIGDADKNTFMHIKLIKDLKKNVEHKIVFPATEAGVFNWTLFIKSDSYKGLDQQFSLDFVIKPMGSIQREIYVHPDDAELDNQPSFFTQIMQGLKNPSDDEEEEDDEELQQEQGKKKKQWKRKEKELEKQEEKEEEEEIEEQEKKNQ